jgi:putative MATE family efflux protein
MLSAPRRKCILALALPIIGGMVSQNVLNLVDTLMVGSLGNAALAAVGIASFANFMCTAFITGLGAGVQAMASRRFGEGQHGASAVPLNGGLVLAIVLGLPLGVALFALAPTLMPLLVHQKPVVALAVPYLQARLVAMVAIGMNFAFRGYWNGVNRSALYFRTLIVMHVSNIALNWVFIYGKLGAPALGSTGAGVASAMATWIGTLTYMALAFRHARAAGFLRRLPDRRSMLTTLRLAVPAGLQQLFFAAGMTAFFALIGRVGTAELAASNVLLNLLLVALLPAMGFGLASASLVGQALGSGDADDARRWAWDVVKLAVAVVALISLPALAMPDLFLSAFLHDAATRHMADWPLRIIALGMPVDAVGIILMQSLMGAGDTRSVLYVSVALQWLLELPALYLVGPVLGGGLVAIWLVQLGYRLSSAGVFAALWHRGRWRTIQV